MNGYELVERLRCDLIEHAVFDLDVEHLASMNSIGVEQVPTLVPEDDRLIVVTKRDGPNQSLVAQVVQGGVPDPCDRAVYRCSGRPLLVGAGRVAGQQVQVATRVQPAFGAEMTT